MLNCILHCSLTFDLILVPLPVSSTYCKAADEKLLHYSPYYWQNVLRKKKNKSGKYNIVSSFDTTNDISLKNGNLFTSVTSPVILEIYYIIDRINKPGSLVSRSSPVFWYTGNGNMVQSELYYSKLIDWSYYLWLIICSYATSQSCIWKPVMKEVVLLLLYLASILDPI